MIPEEKAYPIQNAEDARNQKSMQCDIKLTYFELIYTDMYFYKLIINKLSFFPEIMVNVNLIYHNIYPLL